MHARVCKQCGGTGQRPLPATYVATIAVLDKARGQTTSEIRERLHRNVTLAALNNRLRALELLGLVAHNEQYRPLWRLA